MAPSELTRVVERDYRRAVKAGLPRWAQAHANEALRRSARLRERAKCAEMGAQYRQRCISRALDVLMQVHDMLNAYRLAAQ